MAAEFEKVVIYDGSLYQRGGLVFSWMQKVVNEFEGNAKRFAPVRSGRLREGIFGSAEHIGPRLNEGSIESTAPHSLYVLLGTTGPIMTDAMWAAGGDPNDAFEERTIYNSGGGWSFTASPGAKAAQILTGKRGFFMPLPPWPPHPFSFQVVVSGQSANNFLLKAWVATSLRHRSISGIAPGVIDI